MHPATVSDVTCTLEPDVPNVVLRVDE